MNGLGQWGDAVTGHSFWDDLNQRRRDPEFREGYERESLRFQAMQLGCPGENQALRTGWYGGGYHRTRWWWNPPWKVTRPWLPRAGFYPHGDEHCNDTLLIVLPMLGDVVIRYRRGPIRTKPCDTRILDAPHHHLCKVCGDLWCPSLFPEEP